MNIPGNWTFFFRQKNNVGGIKNLPPAYCLRPAYPAAYVPAYVERTRKPERGAKRGEGLTGQASKNGAFSRWRPAA